MKHYIHLFIIPIVALMLSQRLLADTPPGQIAVSPSVLEVKIGSKPVNESIRLRNLKNIPVTIKVDVYNWTLDEHDKVKILPPAAKSIDQWMVINPVKFTIEPGKEQVIRFSIRPQSTPIPGEYRAMISFTQQSAGLNAGGVEVLFNLGVGVYGYADPLKHAAILNSLTFDRSTGALKVDVQNNGNVHTRLKGDYAIWKKGTFPGFKEMSNYLNLPKGQKHPEGFIASGIMNNAPVLAGSKRTITTLIPLPKGNEEYIVAVEGDIDDKRIEKIFQ